MSEVIVKVIRVPGAVKDVALNQGATVADALAAADMSVDSGEKVSLNGVDVPTSTAVTDGSRIVIAKGAKGNS